MVRRAPVMLLVVVAFLLCPASVLAAPVSVLHRDGRVTHRDDPYLSQTALTPVPAASPSPAAPVGDGVGALARRAPAHLTRKRRRPAPTVGSVLAGMVRTGRLSRAQSAAALSAFDAALAAERHLTGTRRAELSGVTRTVHDIAVDGGLWPSRLPAIIATLNANRRWWTRGTLLAYGDRVQFQGSHLEWEYYPGQGIQLQVLGSFGEANGLYSAGPAHYGAMEQLLAQLIPLASDRGGGLTWEYDFDWEGGSPPWTSAMSQATALQALAHAYQATGDASYLGLAARALGVFTRTPARGGVAVPTARGLRFVQYSFTPGTKIINAFLQTLIGLDTYAQVSHSALATRLFDEGDAEAQWEVPQFNTGAWSLYQPGQEDDLSYHELVTGFLTQLCTLTATPVYCATARAFTADLSTPPVLSDLTPRARARRPFSLRFRLSKISRVGVTIRRGSRVVLSTSATFPHGVGGFSVGKLRAGIYTVALDATDLAGNFTQAPPAPLTVTR